MTLTTRAARRALKHTNQLIGALTRTPTGWVFAQWIPTAQGWAQFRHPTTYRKAQKLRRNCRLVQAAIDCGVDTAAITATMFECDGKGRTESILARASRRVWQPTTLAA